MSDVTITAPNPKLRTRNADSIVLGTWFTGSIITSASRTNYQDCLFYKASGCVIALGKLNGEKTSGMWNNPKIEDYKEVHVSIDVNY